MSCTRLPLIAALAVALAGGIALTPSHAHATDTWSEPIAGFNGIARLHRSIPGQEIHAVFIDLARSELHVRATRPNESGRTTTSFANLVGAAVAINGDWFDSSGPVGLAVGDGQHWPGSTDQNWAFVACTIENTCEIDTSGTDREVHWRWRDLVGGNGAILAIDGQAIHYPDSFYSVDRHPRSAVGVHEDGEYLIFVVVEGRRAGANGMTFNEVADLMVEFGAWDAMMLDGGGSSSLVVGGTRVNNLPAGAGERSVGNHLGVIYEPSPNGQCQVANGRWCNGNIISGCQGNTNLESGDCAAFGATCSVTDGIGHCVHPYCPAGGNGTACIDATQIATCELGALVGQGDCAAFGASCEADAAGAYCVHYMCSQGGNATWCDGNVAKTCTRGEFSETPCTAGETCTNGACGTAEPPADPDPMADVSEPMDTMSEADSGTSPDAFADAGSTAPPTLPDASDADVAGADASLGGGVRLDGASGADGGGNQAEPAAGDPNVEGACACQTTRRDVPAPTGLKIALLLGALALLRWRAVRVR